MPVWVENLDFWVWDVDFDVGHVAGGVSEAVGWGLDLPFQVWQAAARVQEAAGGVLHPAREADYGVGGVTGVPRGKKRRRFW